MACSHLFADGKGNKNSATNAWCVGNHGQFTNAKWPRDFVMDDDTQSGIELELLKEEVAMQALLERFSAQEEYFIRQLQRFEQYCAQTRAMNERLVEPEVREFQLKGERILAELHRQSAAIEKRLDAAMEECQVTREQLQFAKEVPSRIVQLMPGAHPEVSAIRLRIQTNTASATVISAATASRTFSLVPLRAGLSTGSCPMIRPAPAPPICCINISLMTEMPSYADLEIACRIYSIAVPSLVYWATLCTSTSQVLLDVDSMLPASAACGLYHASLMFESHARSFLTVIHRPTNMLVLEPLAIKSFHDKRVRVIVRVLQPFDAAQLSGVHIMTEHGSTTTVIDTTWSSTFELNIYVNSTMLSDMDMLHVFMWHVWIGSVTVQNGYE